MIGEAQEVILLYYYESLVVSYPTVHAFAAGGPKCCELAMHTVSCVCVADRGSVQK